MGWNGIRWDEDTMGWGYDGMGIRWDEDKMGWG
jgi:hypothetical protein